MKFKIFNIINSHKLKSLLGEIGKHDRFKICSHFRVIGSNPIVGMNQSGEIGKHITLRM